MGCCASQPEKKKEEKMKRKLLAKKQRQAMIEKLRKTAQDETLLKDPGVFRQVELLAELPSTNALVWTSDGIVLYVNDALMDLLGHDEDTIRPGNKVEKILGAPEAGYASMVYKEVSGPLGMKQDGTQLVISVYTTKLTNPPPPPKVKGEDPPPPPKVVYCSIINRQTTFSPHGSFGSLTKENPPQNPLEASYGSRKSAVMSQASPPCTSPRSLGRPASPAFDRKAHNAGDIMLVIDAESKLVGLSGGARSLLQNPPGDDTAEDADLLLHENEYKSLRLFLDVEATEALTSSEKRYLFKGLEGVEAALVLVSRLALPAGAVALRFIPPPKKRGVSFMRKTVPDDVAGLMDVLPQPTMLVNKRAKVEYWNPAAEKLFGVTQDEIHGQPLSVIIPHPYAEGHPKAMAPSLLPKDMMNKPRPVVARSFATHEVVPLNIIIAQWHLTSEKLLYLVTCEVAPDDSPAHAEMMGKAEAETASHPLALADKEEPPDSPTASPTSAWLSPAQAPPVGLL